MITSRSIAMLHPEAQRRAVLLQDKCREVGIELLVICTYRDIEAQNELYEHGRTKPGPKVTNAKGGDSFHNYRVAFDAVPLVHGKPLWKVFDEHGKMLPTWETVAKIAAECGLEWAGNWHSFKEYDHFQYTGGLSLADFKEGKELPVA